MLTWLGFPLVFWKIASVAGQRKSFLNRIQGTNLSLSNTKVTSCCRHGLLSYAWQFFDMHKSLMDLWPKFCFQCLVCLAGEWRRQEIEKCLANCLNKLHDSWKQEYGFCVREWHDKPISLKLWDPSGFYLSWGVDTSSKYICLAQNSSVVVLTSSKNFGTIHHCAPAATYQGQCTHSWWRDNKRHGDIHHPSLKESYVIHM